MTNPFQYGNVVSDRAFCNRRKELTEIIRIMENSGRAFIYSERRLGKTSLVKLAMNKLPSKSFFVVYCDLWPTDSEESFVTTLAKALTESLKTSVEKAIEAAKTMFGHLTPSITLDEEGKPTVTFAVTRKNKAIPELDEVLAAATKIGLKGKKKVVIIFDEFQQILEYGNDVVERRLRSIIQNQKNVAYIFLGSRKHVVQKMFLDKSRPLYRAAAHIPLGIISEDDWLPFIRERFIDEKKRITDEQIRSLCRLTQGQPFYTQHLCHVLWELCEPTKHVTEEMINNAIDTLLSRENYAYTVLWESLTRNQQRFLKTLAIGEFSVKPFASEFIQQSKLGSPSNIQRVVESLLEKDVIDHDNGSFIILDRFLRLWIRKVQV